MFYYGPILCKTWHNLICSNASGSVLSVKLKDISLPPPCWVRWGENFPSTTGKLINKAGVKELFLWVVFTPWWETPTQSIVLPQCAFYLQRGSWMCFPLLPPLLSCQQGVSYWETHVHIYKHTHSHLHTKFIVAHKSPVHIQTHENTQIRFPASLKHQNAKNINLVLNRRNKKGHPASTFLKEVEEILLSLWVISLHVYF